MQITPDEMIKVQDYLRRTFGNEKIGVKPRAQGVHVEGKVEDDRHPRPQGAGTEAVDQRIDGDSRSRDEAEGDQRRRQRIAEQHAQEHHAQAL